MSSLKLLYRDVDRAPYLFAMRHCARATGLELEVTLGGHGRHEWEDALDSGAADILAENYWGLQSQAAKGAPYVCVATAVHTWTDKLLAAESVRSIYDLRGKRLAVRALGPQEFLPGQWLRDNGLADDVEQVAVSERESGRWGNWKKVASGECHAAFVSPLYVEPALAAGLHELPYPPFEYVGNVTLNTTWQVIEGKREDMQRLVDAMFQATRMFKTDAAAALRILREEPRELLGQQLDVSTDDRLEKIYSGLRDELAEEPVPTAEAIANTRSMLLNTTPELADFNPLLMWDFSFILAAKRR